MNENNSPKIMITGKDLDYLSDIFDWNTNAYKLAEEFVNEMNSPDSTELLREVAQAHKNQAEEALNILK